MRATDLFARTLRDAPADEEAPSAQLLIRAAFVRKLMAGVYSFLPLGIRVLHKVERIVREEMDAAGAQEIRMPAVLPAEPWKLTGRWEAYGDDMFRLEDRHGRELVLGPTHEEIVAPLVDADFSSYRDLPVNLYQVQWKYRDEPRPRSGLIRGREFLMKDAYTFDRDREGLQVSYAKMVEAYRAIFDRCALDYRMVEADPGLIGGDVNHEFMAPSPIGEDLFVHCTNCDYAANVEAATCRPPAKPADEGDVPLERVSTPGRTTIESVSELLGVPPERVLKCLLYRVGADLVAILVPGNREVNEGKLRRAFAPQTAEMLTDRDFEEAGLAKGFVGPQGLRDAQIVADNTVRGRRAWIAGANEPDAHATGVTLGRDFEVARWEDLSGVLEGDPCPRCGTGTLRIGRAIEVGHTFQLGTVYTEPLKATFVDEDGIERPFVMGCYGIGVSRIVASIAEQHHDDAGLTWPRALAPFEAVVIPTNMDRADVVEAAEGVYGALTERGAAAVLDDRAVTAGVKFADADLIGYPLQVIVGARGLAREILEVKIRTSEERREVNASAAADGVLEILSAL